MHKAFVLLVFIAFFQACSNANESLHKEQSTFTLAKVAQEVRTSFPSVQQLSTSALAHLLANPDRLVLLDAREHQEYAVSHLPSAIRVEPNLVDIPTQPWSKNVKSKVVVFYCSVGLRSSKLANRLQSALLGKGAVSVFNLDGGIFAWHDEERPLENSKGSTDFVHPFDQKYRELLRRKTLARFDTH